MKPDPKNPSPILATWAAGEVRNITVEFERAVDGCSFESSALASSAAPCAHICASHLIGSFIERMNHSLRGLLITDGEGHDHADKVVVRLADHSVFALDLKVTTDETCNGNQVLLACSSMVGHPVRPLPRRLLLTLGCRPLGDKVWVRWVRLDFLSPKNC
jgi:hypothetical protein